jgi:hypothetical protein
MQVLYILPVQHPGWQTKPLTNKSGVAYVTSGRHVSHPQLFITHSNKAASHLALGQHAAALQVTFPPLQPTVAQLVSL